MFKRVLLLLISVWPLIGLALPPVLVPPAPEAPPQRVPCSDSSYQCLNPQGREFPGGVVGPIRMWFSPTERRCIPSPNSLEDGCEQIRRICNTTFASLCHNDCLAGRPTNTGGQESSCEGTFPVAPPASQPQHILQVNPYYR